jgi:allantoate deiminase
MADIAAIALARIDLLGAISEETGRLVRRPLTVAAREAEDLVAVWMTEAGAAVTRDVVGNVFGRRQSPNGRQSEVDDQGAVAADLVVTAATQRTAMVPLGIRPSAEREHGSSGSEGAPILIIGSHIDTVRDAGRYDGALGVVLGIGAVAHIAAREAAGHPALPFALEVVSFAGEEGVRFAAPFLGSRVATGTLPRPWLDRTDEEGIALARAIIECGGNADAATPAHPRYYAGGVVAYVEPHIEQGPVLDTAEEPLGVVSAIVGQTRLRLTFGGHANHAGTTPMDARRDALAGAAATVVAVEAIARATAGLVATVGEMTIAPGAANVVPGAATISLDIRHARDEVRLGATDRMLDAARDASASRSLELAVAVELEVAATLCDAAIMGAISTAAQHLGLGTLRELTSGAGHDAMVMASVAPVGMLFVRSPKGVSHHPSETVVPDDVHMALRVLVATVDEIAMRVRDGSFPMLQKVPA